MSNYPLISVLIPAYNHEKYVQEAITSIINQTYKNLELIVIDDGSKDRTWDKIKELEPECKERFANVMFIHKENGGVVSSLNLGIEKARGEFFYSMASDDIAKPNAIEMLYSKAQQKGSVLTVGDNQIIDSQSVRIAWDKEQRAVPYGDGYATFWDYLTDTREDLRTCTFGSYESLLKGNYLPNGSLIRTKALLKVGGYTKEAPLEDWYMNLQLAKLGSFAFVDEVLFSYRWHQDNTIKQKEKMRKFGDRVLQYEEHLLKTSTDEERLRVFKDITTRTRYIFCIRGILEIYKIKTVRDKKLCLKIFNKEIILRTHKIG